MCRKSGILLHITSLPSRFGLGCFSIFAYDFIKFLKQTNCSMWQVLPFGPTNYGQSPYSSFSSFAGNHYFIDVQEFVPAYELEKIFANNNASLQEIQQGFDLLLWKIYKENQHRFDTGEFFKKNQFWLKDYAEFMAIKQVYGGVSLQQFEKPLKKRDTAALNKFRSEHADIINYHIFLQFVFDMQWRRIKDYANKSGIEIVGDIPFYANLDSCDVWTNKNYFLVDEELHPKKVGGVPPDYFSSEGQLWGNPTYNFAELEKNGYDWFVKRIEYMANYFDTLRLDHFRGFESYWEVDGKSKNAIVGKWKKAPGLKILNAILKNAKIKLFVEDLGILTPDVIKLKDTLGLAGIKIMQFAFDGGFDHAFLPHNYEKNCVAYIGNHDNDTAIGFLQNCDEKKLCKIKNYLGLSMDANEFEIVDAFINRLFSSSANKVFVTMQDLLYLNEQHRMNIPGIALGNWQFQTKCEDFSCDIINKLEKSNYLYGREKE